MTAQNPTEPRVTAQNMASRLANDIHRKEKPPTPAMPTLASLTAATKTVAPRASTTSQYSEEYIQRMAKLVETLEMHIVNIKSYFERKNAFRLNEEQQLDVYTDSDCPALPVMHEWTMDIIGLSFFLFE